MEHQLAVQSSQKEQEKKASFSSLRRSKSPEPVTIHPVQRLQRAIGNQAVQNMVHAGRVNGQGQRSSSDTESHSTIPPIVHNVLKSSGQPLPSSTRAFMESRFGRDFGNVRVHTDAQAAESARAVNALAYTVGRNVVFGRGQYAPGTSEGKRLMAHELTHVVQQSQVTSPDIQRAEPDDKAKSKETTETEEAPDAAIDALDLAPTAKKAAKKLKEKHSEITFTSGRRNITEQTHAMASNIVSSKDRKWIEKTYKSADQLQKWIDDNPKAETVEDIAKGLKMTMESMAESERAKVSKHLTGEAFDVQPQEKDADQIKKDIKELPGITKFLDKEGGLVRWHAQFKKELHISQTGDRYEQEADAIANRIVTDGAGQIQSVMSVSAGLQKDEAKTIPTTGASPTSDWNYDPDDLLDDSHVNAQFRTAARKALASAVAGGLRPKIAEAYRTPEESARKYTAYKSGKGGKAAPAWQSVHNYGLGMDVYLYDADGGRIDSDNAEKHPDWYKQVKQFATKYMGELVWGEPINDTDHFEYHPGWSGLAGGPKLLTTRDWAQKAAGGKTDYAEWIDYFWWKAGTGGREPVPSTTTGATGDTSGKTKP